MQLTYGPCYDEQTDGNRLRKQHEVIREYMLHRSWQTLQEIATATGFPEASVSAQLRHLRKQRFGGYRVEKQRRTEGTWEYRVLTPVFQETLF